MGVFKRFGQKRASAKGFQTEKTASIDQQTFILEPILTPSGILDGQDNTPEPVVIELETTSLPDVDLPDSNDAVETADTAAIETDSIADGDTDLNLLEIDIADEELELLDFVEKPDSTELDSTVEASATPAVTTESFTTELNTPDVEADAPETVTADSIVENDTATENTTEATTITVTSSETVDSLPTNQTTNETTELTESEITNSETKVLTNDSVSQPEPVETQTTEITEPIVAIPSDSFANASPQVNFEFDSGVFTVDETGEVSVDFLFDGGGYKGELAIFSLNGMEQLEPGSEAFIKEAASRALSGSALGHVAISDITEGARFSGNLGEVNQNEGAYLGVKTFTMRPGDTFGIMLVPNGKVQQVFDNPVIDGAVRPLFSLGTANPNDAFHTGQLVDVTGDGNTFVMEDMRVDTGSDKDYNDIIFQVRGATGSAISLDDAIASGKDWRNSDLGQALIAYAEPYINPEPVVDVPIVGDDAIANSPTVTTEPVTNPENAIANSPTVITEPVTNLENASANSPPVITEPVTNPENAIANSPTITTEPISNPENASANSPPVITEPVTNPENASANSPATTSEPVTESPVVSNTSTNQETVTLTTTTEPSNTIEVISSEPSPNVADTSITEINVVTEVTTESVNTSEPISTNLPAIAEPSNTEIEVVKEVTTVGAVTSEIVVESTTSPLITEVKVVTEVVDGNAIPSDSFANASSPAIASAPSTEVVAIETNISGETAAPVTEIQGVASPVVAESTTIAERGEAIGFPAVQPRTNAESVDATATNSNPVTTITSETTTAAVAQTPQPITPVKPPVQFEFPKQNQPLVGVINTGFAANNPDINYERIILGQDRIDGDANPLLQPGEGNDSGTPALGIIGATQNNSIGINGVNDDAPLWVGRTEVNTDQWAQSLTEFVDAAKVSKQPNAIINLSFNLTETNPDSSVTPRFELTAAERAALAYAQRHNVLIVASAGDNPGEMSAIGQASLEFDNIVTVGSAERVNNSVALSKAYDRAEYSGSGYALDIVAPGGTDEKPITVTSGNGVAREFGTSVATAKVSGAASQVWAANPDLSYRQVIDILKRTATDLKTPNWDLETGAGLLNIAAAVHLAKVTPAIDVDVPVRYDFKKSDQPLIGIIDTGFISKNPDIDYRRIILGRDRLDNDNNPLLENGEGSEHGSHILGIIGATQGNGIGIDGMNDDAPIWLGRAIGSGKWAESLREFVDAAKASGQPNAVVNLSFDLTQINPDGSVTTRYELTPQEREALEYARQNGVMVVVAAGNNGGTMSALGQASQEFDNVITVGSIDYNGNRAEYSNFGFGLDFVARGGTPDQPVMSTVGDGADLGLLSGEEEPPEDEMSTIARNTFEEVFGPFSDTEESVSDEQELEKLTPEERQVYDEATKEIDQLLKDYLAAASQKIALEYVDGYYAASVDALSQFVDAFDEDLADNLIKAEEILGNAGFSTNASTTATNLDFSIPLDLGVGEMAGTSVAAAKVTGAVSQVWAANPRLSYPQVKEILQKTAVDLNSRGWDAATGSGLVNVEAAIELAKRTQPQSYQPKPIQSPLTWSGEGKVIPGERVVSVSVPTFTGRVMDAGYVTSVGFLRIRSGPGQNYAEVGRKYPGEAINFDAYENNGSWVDDPYMPGGGSSRWYKIAGTNNWMSALYIDNTPERAEQERQRLEAIRRAEEEARRAEEEARRAEEEVRRAEEELQRILEEQRRAEEEARRRAEEEARRRIEEELRRILEEQRRQQEQLQAAISQISQKVGDLGNPIGNYISNGVAVYQFAKGSLLIQPDGKPVFYEQLLDSSNERTPVGYLADKFLHPDPFKRSLEQTAFMLAFGDSRYPKFLDVPQFLSNVGKKLAYEGVSPGQTGFVLPRFGNFSKSIDEGLSTFKNISDKWDDALAYTTVKNPGKTGFILPDLKQPRFSAQIAKLGINPTKFGSIYTKAAKNAGVFGAALGLAPLAYEFFTASDPTKKREVAVKGAFDTLGTVAGAALFSFIPVPGATILGGFVGGYIGSQAGHWVNDHWDTTLKPLTKPLEDGFNAVSSFTNNAIEAAKAKAQGALEKAKAAAATAKAAYQAATTTIQEAKAAYQTFKQEIQKQTTQIVQQSQQKIKEEAQKILTKVVQNPVVQQTSKVVNHIANYAQKAVQAVGDVINGAKQFANNVINAGKKIVNNVIETGKKAYDTVKNFVANTYETGKKVVTETYNKAVEAVNTVKDTVSNGFNAVKSVFRFGW